MSQMSVANGPTVYAPTPAPPRSALRRVTGRLARWMNRVAGVAAIAQFYTAGLAVFGAASFSSHAGTGYLVFLASFLTMALLIVARAPFRVTRIAMLISLLAFLQPVLAFAPRARFPWLSALHPLSGLVIVALLASLERGLREHG
jgi:hypothetical protein